MMLQQEGDGATGVVDSITKGRRRRRTVAATGVWCCYRPSAAVLPAAPIVAASCGRQCYHLPPALLQAAAGGATFRQGRPVELLFVSAVLPAAPVVAATGGRRCFKRRLAMLLSVSGGAAGPSGVAASGF
jgi:hypothetical protein